jgi:hypothetical protein
MAERATAQLTSRQYRRALEIVERETPTPQQSRWFRRLQQTVWSALLFSAAWVVIARYYSFEPAYPALLLAVACYVALIPLLVVNLGMVRRLIRAARLRRILGLAAGLDPHFRERRRHNRWINRLTLVMSVVGYFSLAIGLLLLFLELLEPDPWGLAIIAVTFAWGLSCVALHFMARGVERLQVISYLHDALVESMASQPAGTAAPVTIPAEHYDAISRLERAQVQADRKRSIAAGLQERADSYVLRLSRSFVKEEQDLDGEVLSIVNEALYRLTRNPPGAPAAPQPSFVPVPGTPLEMVCQVDHDRREVRVYSLRDTAEAPAPLADAVKESP